MQIVYQHWSYECAHKCTNIYRCVYCKKFGCGKCMDICSNCKTTFCNECIADDTGGFADEKCPFGPCTTVICAWCYDVHTLQHKVWIQTYFGFIHKCTWPILESLQHAIHEFFWR